MELLHTNFIAYGIASIILIVKNSNTPEETDAQLPLEPWDFSFKMNLGWTLRLKQHKRRKEKYTTRNKVTVPFNNKKIQAFKNRFLNTKHEALTWCLLTMRHKHSRIRVSQSAYGNIRTTNCG